MLLADALWIVLWVMAREEGIVIFFCFVDSDVIETAFELHLIPRCAAYKE